MAYTKFSPLSKSTVKVTGRTFTATLIRQRGSWRLHRVSGPLTMDDLALIREHVRRELA